MADVVTNQVVFSGKRRHVVHLTSESDSTGESGVVKVDISTLRDARGEQITYTSVERIFGVVNGFDYVKLAWDHTTDDTIAVVSGLFDLDFRCYGGLVDPRSAGGTGDIVLTTEGAADGASYDITIELCPKA